MEGGLFFTTPSRLGRRVSVVDPLGFRGVVTHFLHRATPGFTGRVRGRVWFPVLCWAAQIIEDNEFQAGRDHEHDPREAIRARRAAMANFERALRLGATLRNEQEPGVAWKWRYGNRDRWWELHRGSSTRYRELAEPPFFSSRASELANNALGCLRRPLERHALFVATEARLSDCEVNIIPPERFRLTDRGRELATAFDCDLAANKVERTLLKEWGLFPGLLGRKFNGDPRRHAALKKLACALPITPAGEFDSDRFSNSSKSMNSLFRVARDPLFPGKLTSGPVPALVRALQRAPEAHPLDALAACGDNDDFWTQRLHAARDALAALMGRVDGAERPLFDLLGTCFVEGMRAAFPSSELDCSQFDSRHASFKAHEPAAYAKARDRYLHAWDQLAELETRPEMQHAPRVEKVNGRAIDHFNDWLRQTETLRLDRVVDLHIALPRFQAGVTLPLIERDAGAAFLDAPFPWSCVGSTVSDDAPTHESDVTDTQEALAPEEESEDNGGDVSDGRTFITDYWHTAKVARDVILGRAR